MKRLQYVRCSAKLQANQQVNSIGKYLYKHIDGAYKIENSINTCDVHFMLLYQIPRLDRRVGHPEDKKMHEMHIDLNITTYQNKVRVNAIEESPEERTLSCIVVDPENLVDLESAKQLILSKIEKRLTKLYEDYDFVF